MFHSRPPTAVKCFSQPLASSGKIKGVEEEACHMLQWLAPCRMPWRASLRTGAVTHWKVHGSLRWGISITRVGYRCEGGTFVDKQAHLWTNSPQGREEEAHHVSCHIKFSRTPTHQLGANLKPTWGSLTPRTHLGVQVYSSGEGFNSHAHLTLTGTIQHEPRPFMSH